MRKASFELTDDFSSISDDYRKRLKKNPSSVHQNPVTHSITHREHMILSVVHQHHVTLCIAHKDHRMLYLDH